MESNVNYTIVGAFVLVLTSAIILGIIWLSSGFTLETYNTYLVYMKESVSGLTLDSPVEYNGVNVGSVKRIKIDRDNPRLVEILLNIKDSTPITEGTVATLNSRGITGVTFMALKDDGTDLHPLVKPTGLKYPVIKTSPSLFLRIDTALGEFSKSFTKISDAITSLLDKENLHTLKMTFNHLERLTGNLEVSSHKFDTLLDNANLATKNFTPLLQSGTSAMRMLETQTLPTVYNLMSNLESITSTLKEVSVQLKENPSVLIRGQGEGTLGPGESKKAVSVFGPGENR